MSGPIVVGLWSIVLLPGKTVSQNIAPGIQITNISYGAEVTGNERTVVSIKYPEFEQDSDDEDEEEEEDEDDDDDNIKLPKLITKDAVIALLRPDVTEQVSVNITLVEDVEVVEFSITGPNAVHLVGHYVRQEDFDQEPYSDSEEGDFDSDDEDIDSDLETIEGLSGMLGEEDDEMDSEGDSERFEELMNEKVKATNPKKRVAEEVAAEELAGDESMSSTLSKNQRKKLAKKAKTDAAPAAATAPVVAAPVAAKAEKKAAAAAPVENKIEKKVEKKANAPRTLDGGLIVTDSKVGDGAVAKNGKKIGMRYIGKLDNGKIFDSNTKGSPLSFTLGRGEVIAGWEKGIVGMAVGGERKLSIPAGLAYGKKGTSGIPGGATLHFDVKLVSLK